MTTKNPDASPGKPGVSWWSQLHGTAEWAGWRVPGSGEAKGRLTETEGEAEWAGSSARSFSYVVSVLGQATW